MRSNVNLLMTAELSWWWEKFFLLKMKIWSRKRMFWLPCLIKAILNVWIRQNSLLRNVVAEVFKELVSKMMTSSKSWFQQVPTIDCSSLLIKAEFIVSKDMKSLSMAVQLRACQWSISWNWMKERPFRPLLMSSKTVAIIPISSLRPV